MLNSSEDSHAPLDNSDIPEIASKIKLLKIVNKKKFKNTENERLYTQRDGLNNTFVSNFNNATDRSTASHHPKLDFFLARNHNALFKTTSRDFPSINKSDNKMVFSQEKVKRNN